jgi:lipopolysaccharide exporter
MPQPNGMPSQPSTVRDASVTSRVVAGLGWMMAWRMMSRLLGFISLLVLAGLLKPADFGIVATATAISAAIDGLSSLGVREALVRLNEDHRTYYDAAFTMQVSRGIMNGVLIAVMSLFANDLFGEPRLQPILLILAAVAIIGSFENIGMVEYSRALDFRMQFFLQAGPRVAGFLVVVGSAIVLRSYWALILGAVVSKSGTTAATYVLSPYRPRLALAGWRYLLNFSFWTWFTGLAAMAVNRADPFLLSPVVGTAAFGLYMLALEIAMLPVSELLEPACGALFPGFAMAGRRGSEPIGMGLSIAGALALCTIPFAIGISATSGYLTTSLLGPKWQAAQSLIAFLACGCALQPFSWVTHTVLTAQGFVKRAFAGQAIAAAMKVAAVLAIRHTRDLPLICAVASLVMILEAVMFIVQMRMAGNRELRPLLMTLARAAVSVAVTCGVLRLIPGTWQYIDMGRIAATAAGGGIGLAAFALFFLCQSGLWSLSGRPEGAEARIVSMLWNNGNVRGLLSRFGWFDPAVHETGASPVNGLVRRLIIREKRNG